MDHFSGVGHQDSRNVLIALSVHIEFHAFWAALSIVGAAFAWFVLIPIAALYQAFALGVLEPIAHSDPVLTMLLGFPLFTITGIVSGVLMNALEIDSRRIFMASLVSLLVTVVLLLTAALIVAIAT